MLWVPILQWQSQLSTQLYILLLSKSTSIIFRRWSYSLPYVLYPLWAIPIWFTPCIIKTKHLIPSFNMHFTINLLNWINSLASDNNNYLRIRGQSTNKLMYTHWNHAVLCTKELSTPPYIAFKGMYDIIYDVIDDVMEIEQWKVFLLNILD